MFVSFSYCILIYFIITNKYSVFVDNTIVFGRTNELRDFGLTTHKRKFLFAALRRFVLGAARLVVVRLVGFGDAIA